MANCFCCLSQNVMVCLAHCRQELQQKSWKTARLFLQDQDKDQMFKTKTKTKTSWSKTKTFIFVLEVPRDQDPSLEDYITVKMSHFFIQNCCCITASFTASTMNSWTVSLHWSCLCWRCYHPYVWSAPSRECPPINAFAAILGFKLWWHKIKLQNVGAGDPPIDNPHRWCTSWRSSSTLAIIRVLMATADRMSYAGLDLPVQWGVLYRRYGIAVLSVSAPKYTCTKHW